MRDNDVIALRSPRLRDQAVSRLPVALILAG
jgi:hypothetical protein